MSYIKGKIKGEDMRNGKATGKRRDIDKKSPLLRAQTLSRKGRSDKKGR